MNKIIIFGFLIIVMISSCTNDNTVHENISFYHWKSKAKFNKSYQKAINITQTNKIYLHYFDIETVHEPSWSNDGVFPTYVLKSVTQDYQKFEIVPVVYITNRVFKTKDLDITDLSNRIKKLINQISETQFNKEIKQIQIDCDWTESTRSGYFELLKQLQNYFEIDVTIRLHQIKYKKKTGIPPVKKGTLMLYNVGDLKNKQQNSTLESSIVKQYINTNDAAKKDIVIAGANTQKLVKMMFDELVKDYCYCDIENEISISELASYLHEHHNVQGVLFNQTDYLLADDKQRFIYNSLHEKRYIISQTNHGYDIKPINEECHSN